MAIADELSQFITQFNTLTVHIRRAVFVGWI
jgi:hypothetical protein